MEGVRNLVGHAGPFSSVKQSVHPGTSPVPVTVAYFFIAQDVHKDAKFQPKPTSTEGFLVVGNLPATFV